MAPFVSQRATPVEGHPEPTFAEHLAAATMEPAVRSVPRIVALGEDHTTRGNLSTCPVFKYPQFACCFLHETDLSGLTSSSVRLRDGPRPHSRPLGEILKCPLSSYGSRIEVALGKVDAVFEEVLGPEPERARAFLDQ